MSDKIKEFKKPSDIENCVPFKVKPTESQFNCPMKEEFNVDHYRVLLDGDINNNTIYIQFGYDDNTDYDSGFFLTAENALKLANSIIDKTQQVTKSYNTLSKANIFIQYLEVLLSNDVITNITILPKGAYVDDPSDTMFGSMIMEVSYTIKDKRTFKMKLVSEPYKYKDLLKYENISKELKEKYKSLETVVFDNKKFQSILQYLKRINDAYLKVHGEEAANVEPAARAKMELDEIAQNVIRKINEEKGKDNK